MNLNLEESVGDCNLHSYFLQDGRKISVGRRLYMNTDFQSGVSPFRCTATIQADVSSMVQHVGIPQGQEMPPEVKSGASVAGRGQLLSCGGAALEIARFCCPAMSNLLGFRAFLIPSE